MTSILVAHTNVKLCCNLFLQDSLTIEDKARLTILNIKIMLTSYSIEL